MRRAIIGSLIAFTFLVAFDGHAQTENWNQAKVTALAGELSNAVSGLRDALMNSAQWQAESAMDDTLWGVSEDTPAREGEGHPRAAGRVLPSAAEADSVAPAADYEVGRTHLGVIRSS
jgi:hypothetical protein